LRSGGVLVFILILALIGTACLFFAARVQQLAIRSVARGPTSRIPALGAFVRSARYLVTVRAVGIMTILSAGFLLWALFKSL
jgi:hypothetical protein